jgi:hypothetical protein
MESSAAHSGDAPINPATQRPVRDHGTGAAGDRERKVTDDGAFTTDDLRRWEDQRISALNENIVNIAAGLEGTQEEIKSVFRNELILAFACLVAVGFMFGIGREVMKMKEEASGSTSAE